MISHTGKYIFHHIPKTASIAIRKRIKPFCEEIKVSPEDSTLNPVYEDKYWRSYLSFTVIRDSVERAKSSYSMFMHYNPLMTADFFVEAVLNSERDKILKKCPASQGWSMSHAPTVPDLARAIRLHTLELRHPILDAFDENYKTKIKYVCDFNNLKEDCLKLAKRGIPVSNLGRENSAGITHPRAELPESHLKKLKDYFKEDAEFFNKAKIKNGKIT